MAPGHAGPERRQFPAPPAEALLGSTPAPAETARAEGDAGLPASWGDPSGPRGRPLRGGRVQPDEDAAADSGSSHPRARGDALRQAPGVASSRAPPPQRHDSSIPSRSGPEADVSTVAANQRLPGREDKRRGDEEPPGAGPRKGVARDARGSEEPEPGRRDEPQRPTQQQHEHPEDSVEPPLRARHGGAPGQREERGGEGPDGEEATEEQQELGPRSPLKSASLPFPSRPPPRRSSSRRRRWPSAPSPGPSWRRPARCRRPSPRPRRAPWRRAARCAPRP